MVRERSDTVPAEPQALRRWRSGACSDRRPAQTARIRGGDADTPHRQSPWPERDRRVHGLVHARSAQPHGFPPGAVDQPHRWVGRLPGTMPPIPNRAVSAGTRSTAGAGAIGEPAGCVEVAGRGGTQACGSAGRRRRVAVLCLTVGPAARTRRRRVDAHQRADRHERADPPDCRRRAGGAILPCRRETARGPAHVDNPGALPLRSSRAGQGGGQRGQATIGSAISRSSWRISWQRQRGCGP